MKTLILSALSLLLSMQAFAQHPALHLHPPQRPHHSWKPDRHRNVAAFHAGLGGVGALAYTVGIDYERFFTWKGRVSAVVLADHYQGGTIGGAHSGQVRNNIRGNYVAPGVRYHPAGSIYAADPAIGAFLLLGGEHRIDSRYGDQGYSVESRRSRHLLGAVLGQASVNFHSPYYILTFGLFASGGYIFSNTYNNFNDRENPGDHLYLQFGARWGGQW